MAIFYKSFNITMTVLRYHGQVQW